VKERRNHKMKKRKETERENKIMKRERRKRGK
jgi:hypothetical protein